MPVLLGAIADDFTGATDLANTLVQRGMRAVFDHSWSLLTERQQAVMQALSVFRGGFTREAVQAAVAYAAELTREQVMPLPA